MSSTADLCSTALLPTEHKGVCSLSYHFFKDDALLGLSALKDNIAAARNK